ncbi:MAG: hypothetical protein KUA37_03190 [Desulfomicrobium sp.]|nr:hypothetical protein [Pseudomonadota bacterium]MBV1711001.1 hypothetical protein [Desulfomicrobium sp.]MBU4570655.1 hypothetical protein [Pseudomonadota bacterium]MBU4593419.1 hypothetical protein [Pseudomonadota bacterium]MBV1719267.1 hypothetical protein [Desulfomicrobium sp.]
MKLTLLRRAIWILLVLLLCPAPRASAETTILFTGNSLGEFNPCPS